MMAHTFRGSSWKSALGLESEREVFKRYKAIRAKEREYVPEAPEGSQRTGRSGGQEAVQPAATVSSGAAT
jgi:hypothetical protein